jgi:hypothetical protein
MNFLPKKWAGELRRVKPFSLILHDDQDSLSRITGATDMHVLIRVLTITVEDSVGQGFLESGLDSEFVLGSAALFPLETHDSLNCRRDLFNLAGES